MKNILTIYKLNLPFGEGSLYDKTKYRSIVDELEWFLKYEDIYVSTKKESYDEFEVVELSFQGGHVKVLFYYEKHHFFLPSFQVDLFSEGRLDDDFFRSFYSIFTDIDADEYIFDLITPKIGALNNRIVTDYDLAESFSSFNFKQMSLFLDALDPYFIEEKLQQSPIFRKQLYYLIFLNYKLFKNVLLMDGGISDLEELLGENIDDALKSELTLSKERIEHVSHVNIVLFKKYKEMLEELIRLLKN